MRPRVLLGLVVLALPLSGCGNSSAAKPAPPPAPVPAAAVPTPAMVTKIAVTPEPSVSEAAKYDPKGRRDPFLALDLQEGARVTVAAAKLRGVVRSGAGTLALVDTAEGVGYILKQGDTLADGRLVEIGQDTVVFAVASKAGAPTNRVILRLPE